ncbi:MAG: GAF domain-containing protein, partial [Ktedonobacteraceae bacterium]|nr:GAF domain-containing protein [Ktedonobacteraceae bacterium]
MPSEGPLSLSQSEQENQRLQKALRESEILRELSELLASSLDTTHILQVLVKRVTEVCDVGRCTVWLLDESHTRFHPASYHVNAPHLKMLDIQNADRVWRSTTLQFQSPVIHRLLEKQGILPVKDLTREKSLRLIAEKFLVRSILIVALLREQRIVGMMSLDNPGRLTTFSAEQVQMARAIGQQAAVAIDNARLYQQAQEEKKRAERLIGRAQSIYQVAMAVNSDKDLPEVLEIAARQLVRGLGADGATIALIEGDTLSVVRTTRLPTLLDDTREQYIIPGLNDLPHCLHAAEERRPQFVKASDVEGIEHTWYRQIGLEDALIVPLMAGPPHRDEQKASGAGVIDDISCVGFAFATYAQGQGEPTPGHYAFAQDIAAQCALAINKANLWARANEAARLATERATTLDAVFNAMTEGIIVLDLEGNVIVTNNTAAYFIGVPRLTEKPLSTFLQEHPTFNLRGRPIPPEEFPLSRALRGENVRGERFITRRADGSERHLEVNIVPMFDSGGYKIGLVCAFRDISEQMRVEQRIRRALDTMLHAAEVISGLSDTAEIMRSVLSMALNAIGGARGAVQLYNPEQQIFIPMLSIGFSEEEETQWLQEQLRWLTPEKEHYTGFREQLLQGHATLISAEHCPEPAAISYQTMILAVPITHNKRLLGVLLLDHSTGAATQKASTSRFHFRRDFSIWDIAVAEGIAQFAGLAIEQARWRQEAEIASSNEATMRESNALKDEFLAITAHDFRTPLSIILGHGQMMMRNLKKSKDLAPEILEKLYDSLSNIEMQTHHLTNIVNTFLEVTLLNRGQITLTLEAVDLEEIVQQAVGGHRTTSLLHQISYQIEEAEQPYILRGDQARIRQALGNLLQNAIKYSPQGGPVTISLRQIIDGEGRACAEVQVQDKGIGVPVEVQ